LEPTQPMHPISPALKGLITGIIMIAVTLGLFYTKTPATSPFQYLPYLIYGAGIVWTLLAYRRSPQFTGRFGDIFNQGFRCFIVVTLLMVAFTAIFLKTQPQFKNEAAIQYREFLIKEKNTLPQDIEPQTEQYRDRFNTRFISAAVFGYLIAGVIVTLCCAALLTRRTP
jgi:hypothetical protein